MPDIDLATAEAFRARYRAGIHRWYSAWLHGGFVLGYGALCLVYFGRLLHDVQALQWLTVPLALVFFNWGEYTVHRELGHRKRALGALFYKRHTGDHHSFFVEGRMLADSSRDYRVIFFPPWLIVLYSLLFVLPAFWALSLWSVNVAALFAQTLIAGYLGYEIFHACEHLPPDHPVSRLPWLRQMRQLHTLHHRRGLMQSRNFNIVFPLWDWLYGTLYWEAPQTTRVPPLRKP